MSAIRIGRRSTWPGLLILAGCAAGDPLDAVDDAPWHTSSTIATKTDGTDDIGVVRQKIVRGEPTSSAESVLMISRTDGSTCSASLIGDRVVITARHCIDSEDQTVVHPSMVYVGAGLYGGDRLTRVREILTTPGRDPYTGAGDFAVLVLEASMGLLPYGYVDSMTEPPRRGTILTAVGYGKTDVRYADSGLKRWGTAPLTNVYGNGFASQPVGCYGDSGGPVFLPDGRIWGVLAYFENIRAGYGGYADCAVSDSLWERTDAHLDLIRAAFERAGASSEPTDSVSTTGSGSTNTPGDPCHGMPTTGVACDGSILTWCDGTGRARQDDCRTDGRECASDACAPGPWCCAAYESAGGSAGCNDTCYWAADGECDDGGYGAYTAACAYGSDCSDCGAR